MKAPQTLPQRLFAVLSNGRFHSGEKLAARFDVSRSAVWKAMRNLRALGLPVQAVRRRGYRIAAALAPLNDTAVRSALPAAVAARLRQGGCCWSTASTNAALLARTPLAAGRFDFLAAEYQTAGRGRRGRGWLAPPGGAICLSLGWTFPELPPDASALSLAMGVCVLRALRAQGVKSAGLKWPNDLVAAQPQDANLSAPLRKLGGILIELRAESAGPAYVVIGIGLNLRLDTALILEVVRSGIQPVTLADLGFPTLNRNVLIADILAECIAGLLRFQREGFGAFVAEWCAADQLRDAPVTVHSSAAAERGLARGIDAGGALLVESGGVMRRYLSGDVSLRRGA